MTVFRVGAVSRSTTLGISKKILICVSFFSVVMARLVLLFIFINIYVELTPGP